MARRDPVGRALADHEARIRRLEKTLLPSSKGGRSTANAPASPKGLPDHILRLRESRYFTTPRTAEEVHKKLQSTYQCELNRVGVALNRLADRKKLRKASRRVGQRTFKAYVW